MVNCGESLQHTLSNIINYIEFLQHSLSSLDNRFGKGPRTVLMKDCPKK